MLVCSQNDMMFKFKADIMANLLTVQPTKRVKHMYCMTGMLPSTTNYVRIKEGLTKKSRKAKICINFIIFQEFFFLLPTKLSVCVISSVVSFFLKCVWEGRHPKY